MNVLRSRAVAVLVILSLIVAWLLLEQTGSYNPVREGFARVLSPVQFVVQRLTRPFVGALAQVTHLARIQRDNETLRSENLQLRNQIMRLQEAQLENETLRKQLSYKSSVPSWRLLAAEVIGHDPNNVLRYIIIDRGSADGLALGMPVLAAEGLVGRVSEVSSGSAKVMLITDPSSSVSALIQRSRATGIVQGYPGESLVMRYIPPGDAAVAGDVVLTSGLGGNFPRRLVIGRVATVVQKDVQMFQEATLEPVVHLRDVESVLVLLSFTATDASQADLP